MIENTSGRQNLDNENETNSSLGNIEEGQQIDSHTKGHQQDATATQEEIENANKPQPNVILNKTAGSDQVYAPRRDTQRVGERANEASDSTDTNTGGIIAGGAKGASQS
jgi:hypothetical protein